MDENDEIILNDRKYRELVEEPGELRKEIAASLPSMEDVGGRQSGGRRTIGSLMTGIKKIG